MKILITGANGFIGSNVAERLLHDGHHVRGLVRKTGSLTYLRGKTVELVYGDVTDKSSVDSAVQGMDVVIHVAGLASDWGHYLEFYNANVVGTQHAAESASKYHITRFVHISTTALHGFPGFRNATEETPFAQTIWHYCETKKIAEQWLLDYARRTGLDVCVVRPGNVFGINDHTFFEKYADALMDGKLGYVDHGKSLTCPTYVENLVEGIVLASFEPGASGNVFIITDGMDVTWREFTEKIADALGFKRPSYSLPFWLGYILAVIVEGIYSLLRIRSAPLITRYRISNGGKDYHFSIEKATRILGYKPLVGLDEAIRRSVEWYQNRKK